MKILQEKADTLSLGIYIHVPFCARSCDFCSFYQEAPDRQLLDRYLKGIELELKESPPTREVETVFWGGGTPGLLTPRDLERLGSLLIEVMPNRPKEWTVEMAPATVTADRVQVLKDLGVNRISIGVQSFQKELLDRLGRIHAPSRVYQAIETLHAASFANFNLDLIFAIPGQSLELWEADIREAVKMNPAHLSTYCLTFEEDTALWVKLHRGDVVKHKIEDEADYYERGWQLLDSLGYNQYEISNFSRPGFECLHNMSTWRMQEWLAYGPSASGQFGGIRYTREPNLDRWLTGGESGKPAYSEYINVSSATLAADALIFGLRMNLGVDLAAWEQRFQAHQSPELQTWMNQLLTEKLAEVVAGHFRLTLKGRLLADRIGMEIMEILG